MSPLRGWLVAGPLRRMRRAMFFAATHARLIFGVLRVDAAVFFMTFHAISATRSDLVLIRSVLVGALAGHAVLASAAGLRSTAGMSVLRISFVTTTSVLGTHFRAWLRSCVLRCGLSPCRG